MGALKKTCVFGILLQIYKSNSSKIYALSRIVHFTFITRPQIKIRKIKEKDPPPVFFQVLRLTCFWQPNCPVWSLASKLKAGNLFGVDTNLNLESPTMIQPFVPIYFYSIQNQRKHGDDGKVESPLSDALSVQSFPYFHVKGCRL